MTAGTLSLTELVELSVGTPEVVNYKGLRTLLLAIVSNLKLGDVKAELNEADKQELLAAKDVVKESATKITEDRSRPSSSRLVASTSQASHVSSISDAYLHNLEQKVSKLENQMEALNALPSNENLMQMVRTSHYETGTPAGTSASTLPQNKNLLPHPNASPVSEMWQMMQVQKKAAANEEGVGKLMSMVEDIMHSIQDTKDQLNKYNEAITQLKDQLDKINSDNAELRSGQEELKSGQNELKSNQDNLNTRLTKIESSTTDEEKMMEQQKLLNDVHNRLNTLPPIEMIVTWPGMEDALKGIYKEPASVSDGWVQTSPVTESMEPQTTATSQSISQTRTPSPPPHLPTSMSSRPSSAMSSAVLQPTREIQKILKEIGQLTGKHNALQERVNLLEELMENKADLEKIQALLGERKDVPEDLANMLADLKNGLDSLHASEVKMDQLSRWIEEQSKLAPATQQDIAELREHLERIHCQLAADIDSLINGLPVGRAVSLSALEKLSNKLHSKLDEQSSSLGLKINQHLSPLKSKIDHIQRKLDAVGKTGVGGNGEVEERVPTPEALYDIDSDSITEMQNLIVLLQTETDKLNATCVQLVDELNSKQKHIDALYTFIDRLQENKADKEHVNMEIDIKADKRMVENKVSRTQFQGTVDEIAKNLNDVMSKLSGHKNAWEDAVDELKLGIDNKLDRLELDPLKAYLEKRIKAVNAKVVKKELEYPEDAAGFRRPLQKFNCISCDRPLDLSPQPPLASLPENKGLPGMRTGRPHTTFELEQIRAAQKNAKPGRNVQHYERALFEQDLARQRKQDILAYIVHFENAEKPPTFCMRGPVQHMSERFSSHYNNLPDYFVTARSCGGSHTMTYPHRRQTRTPNTQLAAIVQTDEDMIPVKRHETDIQGADGHIYRARIDPTDIDRLPTLTTNSKPAKFPKRTSSACGRMQPPSSAATQRISPRPSSARPESRSQSARRSPRLSPTQNVNPTTPPSILEANTDRPNENKAPSELPSSSDPNAE